MIDLTVEYEAVGLEDATPEELDAFIDAAQDFLTDTAIDYILGLQAKSHEKHQSVQRLVEFCHTGR